VNIFSIARLYSLALLASKTIVRIRGRRPAPRLVSLHDQDDVAEVERLAVWSVRLAVVHQTQQDVEKIGVGVWALSISFEQQPTCGAGSQTRVGQQVRLVEGGRP